MKNELTLKSETQLAPELSEIDILSIYNVPASIDKMVEKNKSDLLNKLNCGAVLVDAFAKIGNSTDFMVDIPAGLRDMLKSGKAVFDNSAKSPGNFTPNIRIVGKNGIQGQATIYEGTNPQSVTNGLANIAMMAMVQSVLAKMEIIDEKLDSIVQGQKNDRVGKIIGSFKTFMDLYPTFQSDEEMRNSANQTYQNMQIGLAQIHLDIDEKRKALESAPTNHWKSFWNSIRHPSRNDAERYQNYYTEFIYDMQLYNRLILLTDIVLQSKGASVQVFEQNHKPFIEYCNMIMDDKFKRKMNYLTNSHIEGIYKVCNQNDSILLLSKDIDIVPIHLECKKSDCYKLIKEN